jgi:predicted Zn-dependent protease
MKSTLTALIASLALFAASANAQQDPWQLSYQFETASKYADAISAIDNISANSADAELKSLRRGWLFYLQGNYNDSIREYRLASERNSRSVDARLGITLPLLAQKRWREAEQNARASLELSPNNYTGLLRLAIALEGQRDWANMVKAGTALVTSYPSDASAYVYLARAHAWLNNRAEAVTAYRAVLSRYPGHLEALAYIEQK